MKRVDPLLTLILSELSVNLSAGWFGAAFIVPFTSQEKIQLNLGILTVDAVMGILFLGVAFKLRKIRKDKS
ncbi:hypothetical protein HY008_03205 [Candidatus Woesebacteria bacterium]|nr:hypothetical protein [Candidatus Woesebacteria bacterium]